MALKMKVIKEPKPSTRTVLAPDFVGPVFKGQGGLSYECGSCGTILLEKVSFKQIQNVVVKCGKCGKHNEIPRAHHLH